MRDGEPVKAGFRISTFLKCLPVIFQLIAVIACASPGLSSGDPDGNTELHYAVCWQNIALVRRLICGGADVNAVNNQGMTPLQYAAALNNSGIMQLLVDSGADANYSGDVRAGAPDRKFPANILSCPGERLNFFLTFDAGSDNSNLGYILDTLRRYRLKATFFITGRFMEKYPDDVKRIAESGHVVGNHTYSHSLRYRSEKYLVDELYETECIYRRITGREITKIWRAPYLCHRSRPWMLRAAEKMGYRHVDVSLSSRDWVEQGGPGYVSNGRFFKTFSSRLRAKRSAYHGAIMLMHTGNFRKGEEDFVYILDEVILRLLGYGYVFDNCLRFG